MHIKSTRSDPDNLAKYDWLADSRTTYHIDTMREMFIDYEPPTTQSIHGTGGKVQVKGRGNVTLNFRVNGRTITHKLQNVLHAPNAANCLLSVSCLDQAGGRIEFANGTCRIVHKSGQIIG